MPYGGVNQSVGVRGLGDIGGDGDGIPAGSDDLITGRLDGAGAPAGDGQIGAGAGQRAYHLQAQPGAAAGDDDHLAVQIEVFQHQVSFGTVALAASVTAVAVSVSVRSVISPADRVNRRPSSVRKIRLPWSSTSSANPVCVVS